MSTIVHNTGGGGGVKVTVDGVEFKDRLALKTIDIPDESVSTLPYAFYGGRAVIYNDEIHILGSGTSKNATYHQKYDGTSWTSASTLPYSFTYGTAVVYEDEIYIIGSSATLYKNSAYKWNGSAWTSISSIGNITFSHGDAVVYDDEIHILGCETSPTTHKKYDGSSWTSVSTLPYDFYNGVAVVKHIPNQIHLLGGDVYPYRHYMWYGSAWTRLSDMPFMASCCSGVILRVHHSGYPDDEIHILGLSDQNDFINIYHCKYDEIDGWIQCEDLPYELEVGSAVVYEDKIHILGGTSYRLHHYCLKHQILT